jgi:hypothetical protein
MFESRGLSVFLIFFLVPDAFRAICCPIFRKKRKAE